MSELRSRLRRVGHKGADLIAPGNTFASFDAAVAAGVDMIEFDVLREETGRADPGPRLGRCGDPGAGHAGGGAGVPRLRSFSGIELDLDLKLPGYELRVLDALRTYGLLDRALISTQYRDSLALLRAAEPSVRLGWSVPKLTRDPFRSRATRLPALVALQVFRRAAAGAGGAGGPGRAVRRAHGPLAAGHAAAGAPGAGAGGELYVWTVDELPRLRALDALGVTGVITNDPRLFGALA